MVKNKHPTNNTNKEESLFTMRKLLTGDIEQELTFNNITKI